MFVRSPYHNDRFNPEKILELLELLDTHQADPDDEALSKKELNLRFFPEHDFQEKAKNPIDSLASDLFSLVRQFILWEDAQEFWGKGREYLALARFYRRKNLEDRFHQVISQFRRFQRKHPHRDASFFLQVFQMEEEVAIFESIFNTYTDDSNLVAAHIALDNFYTIAKLEFASALHFQEQLGQVNTGEALRLSALLLKEYDDFDEIHSPAASLYRKVIQLLQKPDDQALFATFEDELFRFEESFTKPKYRNLMAFYRYFIGLRYQQEVPGPELLPKLFELYKQHLAKGYFHVEDDKILPASLKLMVNIAIKVGAYDWAYDLLKKYPPRRIAGTRFPLESHQLCAAEISFAENNYNEAHDLLVYKNFENINYSILADILLIKIYFSTENELLESRIRALEQKVRRSKLTAARKEPYLNFLKVMYRVVKYQWQKEGKKWQRLAEEVPRMVPIIEREWLLRVVFGV